MRVGVFKMRVGVFKMRVGKEGKGKTRTLKNLLLSWI
jgi:hypothetical protein